MSAEVLRPVILVTFLMSRQHTSALPWECRTVLTLILLFIQGKNAQYKERSQPKGNLWVRGKTERRIPSYLFTEISSRPKYPLKPFLYSQRTLKRLQKAFPEEEPLAKPLAWKGFHSTCSCHKGCGSV